jgi:cytosine/adenosine deaminase-related metal-dependent hydrolase
MTHYRAAWVLPISDAPIRGGWIAVSDGRVAALGARAPAAGSEIVDLGPVAILPGLVNAHTHLELSYLRDEVPPSSQFVAWIRGVMAARRQRPDANAPEILAALDAGIAECVRCGTAVVGDISNTLVTVAALQRSPLAGVVFYELLRFNAPDPQGFVDEANATLAALPTSERIRATLAAHAPYSVAPLVLRAIRGSIERTPFVPCSIHLSESAEEIEFIRDGSGPWRSLLEAVGAWDPQWTPPGCTPVQFLDESGFLDARVLAVHGVQMTVDDLARLAARGTTLVTCPRSNFHTGAGAPPIAEFYRSGVRIAVGTDSLASTPDLNVFAELATLRALAPSVPARRLLESATIQGARALGFDAEYGTIEPGKSARLIAVDTPAGTEDVEEYLVGGIRASQIRWLGDVGTRRLGD